MNIKELTQCFGPSGREKEIAALIKAEAEKYADEVYEDALGSVIAHKKGNGKKIMLAAHMDEIGIVATFIDENGFIRFSNIGGVYIKRLLNRRVKFKNGVIGVIDTENDNKEMKLSKLFIDIGAKNKAEADKLISVGDMAVFVGEYEETENVIISKALDNRIGCAALLDALKSVSGENDLYFCFTSQEEVGLRGSRAVAYSVAPEYAIAVDVTDTGDTPNCDKMAVKLGWGAAIKVMDRSVICHNEVRGLLIELAKNKGIPYQLEVMTDGGTDAGAIHTSRDGVKTGGISIPTRYIHSPSEMVSKADYSATVELLKAFLEYNI